MASINHDPGALWDWDSVLLLAHPLAAAEESGAQAASGVGEDEEQQQQPRRRRDPRLSCPNYLAGRVPCACSDEEDDDEGDRSHKRSKLAPRCQVPNCKSDLFGLKGYHQRHRVCLNCANATSVFLRNQHQRYCQQCGKFHPLADFDNGKRSCRRKLEKHNDRRRRKLPESPAADAPASGEPSMLSSDKDAPSSNNTNNSEGSDAGGVTHRLPETPNGSESALYSLESHEQRFRGKEQAEVLPHEHEAFALDTSASGDETLLALLLDEQEGQQHNKQQLQSTRQQEKNDKHSMSSSGVRRRAAGYTPPCPTRRISFKFYDWNPADFPRRLRGQILEWLANMPVELEGYIRSGCTILTLYIAMPETGWTKLHEDWNGQLMRLIAGAEAGFWDKGFVSAFLDNQVAYIDHGLVSSPSMCDKAIKKYPVIQTVSPICLEAGKRASVMVTGHNLLELNSRLLVGSEGKYLACYVSSRGMSLLQVDIVTPGRHGVGFIEVAYDYGMSNFVPVLIADRDLCREVQTLELEMQLPNVCCSSGSDGVEKQQEVFNLLLDLGWVARRLQDITSRLTLPVATDSDLARLQQLLIFVTERKWCTAAQQVLQVSRSLHLLERVGIQRALQLAVLRNNADITSLLLRFADYSTKKSTTFSSDSPWSRYAGSIQYAASRPRRQQHRLSLQFQKYIFKAALGVAVACAGLCIVLQHPQRVLDLSTSLRRCLWYKQQP